MTRQQEIIAACTHAHGRRDPCCVDCWNAAYQARREDRRAQLDAMPRCEACGKRRGNWQYGPALLCGRCMKKAQAGLSRLGIVGAIATQSSGREELRQAILTWAGKP